MPASTVKRVVLYRFDRQPQEAIVAPGSYLQSDHVELITLNGTLLVTSFAELKALCFVFDGSGEGSGADLFTANKLFERRPRAPGLWTRFTFRDGDRLDGILSQNLIEWPEAGYFITPPRAGANRQRVFLPRKALIGTELRGVVGRSSIGGSRREKPDKTADKTQLRMFDP